MMMMMMMMMRIGRPSSLRMRTTRLRPNRLRREDARGDIIGVCGCSVGCGVRGGGGGGGGGGMSSKQGLEIGRGRAPSRARRADYAVFPLEVFARDVVDGRHGYGDAFSLFFWRYVLLCRDCARGVGCQARAGGCRLPRVVIVDVRCASTSLKNRSGRGWRGRNPYSL